MRSATRCGFASALLLSHACFNAQAMELGDLRVHSVLGRQLKASVPLTGDDARESEGRCFKATLVNLNLEPLSPLKVTLQHFSTSSVLLLSGGTRIDEPAAMVVVENTCGAVMSREYAVLLEPAASAAASASATPEPTMTPAPATVTSMRPDAREHASDERGGAQKHRSEVRDVAFFYPIAGMPGMKMAAVLGEPDRDRNLRAVRQPLQPDSTSHPQLKIDRSLTGHGWAGMTGAETPLGPKAWIIGALSLLALLGAAGWIILRIREMRAAATSWMPGDVSPDAAGGDA